MSNPDVQGEVREARCVALLGFIDYEDVGFHDRDGNPIEVYDREGNRLSSMMPAVLRWRCRKSRCLPRDPTKVTVHRQTLYRVPNSGQVGDVTSTEEDTRPISELTQYLPPGQVRILEPG